MTDRSRRHAARRAVLAAVVALLLTGVSAQPAAAQFATGGSGRFGGAIAWFSWGTHGASLSKAATTRTNTFTFSNIELNVTCSLGPITTSPANAGVQAYRPGAWSGDGLDDLYNIGGTGGANQLVTGISADSGSTVRFTYACSAAIDGRNFPLGGLVVADAEQIATPTAPNPYEYVRATIPASATWRVVDRFRSSACTSSVLATRDASNTLEFRSDGTPLPCGSGPMAVMFADGATSGTVAFHGGGKSAVALGVLVSFDHGDAPASYGDAAHALQYPFTGGDDLPVATSRAVSENSFALAGSTQPTPRLGASVDPERGYQTANADGDDLNGSGGSFGPADDETSPVPASIVVQPGDPVSIPNIPCTAPNGTPVRGWIDFNGDGDFLDTGERVNGAPTCTGGNVSLAWTTPSTVVRRVSPATSFVRLRIASSASQLASPAGVADDGEAEDYPMQIQLPPRLTVRTVVDGRVSTTDQFATTTTGAGLPTGGLQAATSASATSATSGTSYATAGGTYPVGVAMASGSASSLSAYTSTISCVNTTASNAPVSVTGTAPNWTTAALQNGQEVVCTVTVTGIPALTLDKQASAIIDLDGNGPDAGDAIDYSFVIRNTGGQPLSPTVNDPKVGTVVCPSGTIAPGASVTCTKRYLLTQADVNSGAVANTATASGQPPTGSPVTATDTTSTPITRRAQLALVKRAGAIVDTDGNGVDVGDTITYSFVVTNTGNETLTAVAVTDPLVGAVTCPSGALAPGASVTCTASPYVLSQANIDAPTVQNTANATGTPSSGGTVSASDSVSVPTPDAPGLLIDKQAGSLVDRDASGHATPGDTITYAFSVTNTGNVTLAPVTVRDPTVGTVRCPSGALAPGSTLVCESVDYPITSANVAAGAVENRATASGTPPSGPAVTGVDVTATALPAAPSVDIRKQAGRLVDLDSNGSASPGDTIVFTFKVTNTGNTRLTAVSVTDVLPGTTVTCPSSTLLPGAAITCTATAYSITQADITAGTITNTASVTGTPPSGPAVTDADTIDVPVPQSPTIALAKVANVGSGVVNPGDLITYSFTVRNTGNVPLSGLALDDPLLGGPIPCTPTTLAPGASATCVPTAHAVTLADISSGTVNNTATATGNPPAGAPVTSTASTTTAVPSIAALALEKNTGQLTDLDGNGIVSAGDMLRFTFRVRNSGNQPLDAVVVDDPAVGGVSCPQASLAVGASMLCTSAPYAVTQADVDAGEIVNTAVARGLSPTLVVITSAPATRTTPLPSSTAITLRKLAGEIVDVNGDGIVSAGDTIAYTFDVTNAGNRALTAVAVSDPLLGTVTCPSSTLGAGATMRCTAPAYTLLQSDFDAGSRTNTATATGTPPGGAPNVTSQDSVTTPLPAVARIALEKSARAIADANASGKVDAGDTLPYTFVVRNTGNASVASVAVSDPAVGPITCSPTSLAPGASATCGPASYTLTQTDLDRRAVTNTAAATGTGPGGAPVPSVDDTITTPVSAPATIRLTKVAGAIVDLDGNGTDVGDTIAFSFTVQNTGSLTLGGIAVKDDSAGTVTCPKTELAPDESMVCSSPPHAITTADLVDGQVRNVATVTAIPTTPGNAPDPREKPATDTSSTVTVTAGRYGMTLDKQASQLRDVDNNGPDAGDEITYTFVIANTGNLPLDPITVSDPTTGPVSCPAGALAAGSTTSCTVTYSLSQADVDAGSVANTATAHGGRLGGGTVDASDSTSVPVDRVSRVTLNKRASPITDVTGNGIDAGDRITYTFVVTNAGNQTLTQLAVADPKVGTVTCPVTTLAPKASTTCTAAPYSLTQADIDAPFAENTATVTGQPTVGSPISATDTVRVATPDAPAIELDKQAGTLVDVDASGHASIGDRITYSFTTANRGNVTLTSIDLVDPKVGAVSCPGGALAPGTQRACTPVVYLLTAADVDAGAVNNTANVSATGPGGGSVTDSDSTSTPVPAAPSIDVRKSAGTLTDVDQNGVASAGDRIAYTFTVTNTGNLPLTSVGVVDPKVGTITCGATALAPGASTQCVTATPYTVTQADIDVEQVTNTATASGTPPASTGLSPVTDTDTISTPVRHAPSLRLDKAVGVLVDANGNELEDPGDTLTYAFTITNTGNLPLASVVVSDPKVGPVTCPAGALAPGASVLCTPVVYTVSNADVLGGSVNNSATASGTPQAGGGALTPVTDVDTTSTAVPSRPAIALRKQVGNLVDVDGNGIASAGDTIRFTFVVRNAGNQPLHDIRVDDPKVGTSTCDSSSLGIAERTTCIADAPYVITQQDVDAGTVSNVATASGLAPGPAVVQSQPDSTATAIPDSPSITIDKRAGSVVDVDGNGLVSAGDTIAYTFDVANTGNRALTAVGVTDPKVGAVTCPQTTLQPKESVRCTAAPYGITQADIVAGAVDNTATARGDSPTGAVATATDQTSTPTPAAPAFTLKKAAAPIVDANSSQRLDAGDTVTYSFTVTNVGNVDLSAVSVTDPKLSSVTCPGGVLAPGDSRVCTAPAYVLLQADIDDELVENTATATAQAPGGATLTRTDSVTVPLAAEAVLELVKTSGAITDVNGNGIDAGDTIVYTFVVTNAGARTMGGLVVDDRRVPAVTCPKAELAPAESMTCTAPPYALTSADLADGEARNVATVSGRPTQPGSPPNPAISPSVVLSETTNPTPGRHSVRLVKRVGVPQDVDGNGIDAGDTVAYTFDVTNTGNLTFSSIAVADPMLSAVDCPAGPVEPQVTVRCTAPAYVLTQADIDRGRVVNTATATGTPASGAAPVTATDTATLELSGSSSLLALEKRAAAPVDADRNGVINAGDTVAFSFLVHNPGTRTATDVAVSDPKVGAVSCPAPQLAPGTSMTCTAAPYRITAAEAAAGRVSNTATATSAAGVTVADTVAVATAATGTTTVTIQKTANAKRVNAGRKVRYAIRVRNRGPFVARNVQVCDTLPKRVTVVAKGRGKLSKGKVCWTVARLNVGQSASFALTLRIDADAKSGRVVNVATVRADNARAATARRAVTVRAVSRLAVSRVTG